MNTSMSYFNKEVYVGIDVHKASYSITAVCDKKVVKSATVKANVGQTKGVNDMPTI